MIIYSEGATKLQEDEATMILDALTVAYPGYPWGVRVYDGGAFIRHLDFPSNWGMNVKLRKSYSASQLKREVILMAGEWLERANLKRGRANDDEIGRVEGVPEKFQPPSEKDPVPVLIAADGATPLRDVVRPQAKELITKNGYGLPEIS